MEKAIAAKRIGPLDGLRGLAALVVVLFHYTARYSDAYSTKFLPGFKFIYGHYGVQLFFIISGFVIYMTIEKVSGVRDFAYRRWSRLYPTYWLCLIITLVSVHLLGPADRSIPVNMQLLNVTMLQGILAKPHVDSVYWSLSQELLFYLLIAVVAGLKQLKNIRWICLGWMALTVAFWFVPFSDYKRSLLNTEYSMLFTAGIYFYRIYKDGNSKSNWAMVALAFVVALGEAYKHPVAPKAEDFAVVAAVITGCFGLFSLFVLGKLEFFGNKFLGFFGAISYPLYLLHQNIGYGILQKLEGANYSGGVFLLIPLLVSIGLASLVTYGYEARVAKYLRQHSPIKKKS